MTREEWIAAFAREAGVTPPSVAEIGELLDLAGTAAHASERTAAPLACWIAGRSARSLQELRAAAERVDAGGDSKDGADGHGADGHRADGHGAGEQNPSPPS
jgi:hypothetical protein